MPLTFNEQLTITLIDKGVIGLLLLGAGFAFNRMLEGFRTEQTKAIDSFRTEQTKAIEALRSDLTLKLEKQREQRAAIADFAKKVSVGYQAMAWLTWTAKCTPQSFSSETDIDGYNNDMKRSFPEIVGARVVASAVNVDREDVTEAIATQLYDLDDKLATLGAKYKDAPDSQSRSAALEEIGNMHQRIIAADTEFVAKISNFAKAPQPKEHTTNTATQN
jgi:predicted metalloprotease with PDZ domain